MAPELLEKIPYSGKQIDLYAAAVLLFCMRTGTHPFIRCSKTDKTFELFHRQQDKFWELFSAMKGDDNYFDPDFKDLIGWMLQYLPKDRPSTTDIKLHKYLLKGKAATLEEITKEFDQRRERMKKECLADLME